MTMEIDPDTVAQIMSVDLKTVSEEQRLSEVRHLMVEHRIHHVPVVKGRACIGLVSSTDLMRVNLGDTYTQTERVTDALLDVVSIREAMQEDIRMIPRDMLIEDAVGLFVDGLYHSLPVVDEDGCLVGMLTTIDLIKHLRSLL
jgi:CBS domain-containing protein